ncbi:response regulator [Myxococcota bacterium]
MVRCILIDEDPGFAESLRGLLEAEGHTLEYHHGAFGALSAVHRSRYDVILLDVEVSGPRCGQLVEYLHDRGVGGARVYLVSSLPEHRLGAATKSYGAHGCLCKDWGYEKLLSFVRSLSMSSQTSMDRLQQQSGSFRFGQVG